LVDSQARVEISPAGKHLEIVPLADGKIAIDFNMAYYYFFTYNEMWSCPFPPAEKRAEVSIRAGKKVFKRNTMKRISVESIKKLISFQPSFFKLAL
jgi:uncharacterized protein (DUF1684 family)